MKLARLVTCVTLLPVLAGCASTFGRGDPELTQRQQEILSRLHGYMHDDSTRDSYGRSTSWRNLPAVQIDYTQ